MKKQNLIKEKSSGIGTNLRIQLAWLFGIMFVLSTIGFYSSLFYLVGIGDISLPIVIILSGLGVFNAALVFTMSIKYIKLYKERGLAVTAIVFSSIYLLDYLLIVVACFSYILV